MHQTRQQRLDNILMLDPKVDFEEIYRRTVLWEFPSETRLGFQLAFYRPMASPRIAKVLVATGHFLRDTTKRAYDSAIVVHEIIANGIDSDRGRRMVALMNKLHDRPDIEQEDLTYILLALLIEPIQLIQRYGFRPLHPNEIQAAVAFYAALGERMGIRELPTTYKHACSWFESYERRRTAPSAEAKRLTAAVVEATVDRMPKPVRGWAAQIMASFLGDPQAAKALGLPPAGFAVRVATNAAMKGRRYIERYRPARPRPSFTPGQVVRHAYPEGYRLEEVGPDQAGKSLEPSVGRTTRRRS